MQRNSLGQLERMGVKPSRLFSGKPCSVILRQNKQEIFSFKCTSLFGRKELGGICGHTRWRFKGQWHKKCSVLCEWRLFGYFFFVVFKRFLLFPESQAPKTFWNNVIKFSLWRQKNSQFLARVLKRKQSWRWWWGWCFSSFFPISLWVVTRFYSELRRRCQAF